MNRNDVLAKIHNHPVFDIIIIGGGATGIGAALEGALKGHRVILLERSDFTKGTSSRSTKLIHGGVRYLAQGNFFRFLYFIRNSSFKKTPLPPSVSTGDI